MFSSVVSSVVSFSASDTELSIATITDSASTVIL